MLSTPLESLKKYVNQPSGSWDTADVAAVAELFAEDFSSLGFAVKKHQGPQCGPTLECTIGTGEKTLMLMGHMDTVFPHGTAVPFTDNGDGTAQGSGLSDMKGGIVIMLYALADALPHIDLTKYSIRVILNPDEEIGSIESHEIILASAKSSFAALSFEPSGEQGRLTCARKGVTNVRVDCRGVPGHAGAKYKECASAVQALCAQITKLYTLRDDANDISFNAGLISGGTAENVVAGEASCRCEFRYFNEAIKPVLVEKMKALCAQEPVPGVTTSVSFGASHPAIDLNENSRVLLDKAQQIAREQGRELPHERVGGAGDISIAGQAGIGVLDGLGVPGGMMHTAQEYGILALVPQQIELASRLMQELCK